MKVLFVCCEQPFPPNNGVRIPSWNMIKYFPNNWELTIYPIVNNDTESLREGFKGIKNAKLKFFKPLVQQNSYKKALSNFLKLFLFFYTKKPSFNLLHPDKNIKKNLKELFAGEEYDIVIFDTEYLACYFDILPKNIFSIISPNDSITLALKNEIKYGLYKNFIINLYKKINAARSLEFEKKYYKKFDLCHFVSRVDQNFISQYIDKEKIIAVPNGIRLKEISYIPPSKNLNRFIIVGALTGGNLEYTKRFIRDVWIPAQKLSPKIELTIVSRINPKEIKNLCKKYNISIVNYEGDLDSFYQNFGFVISPVLKDCGILNKVLEGMANKRAVMGYQCSFFGIEGATKNFDHFSAKDEIEFINLIVDYQKNGELIDRIGLNAYEFVSDNFNWKEKIDFLVKDIKIRLKNKHI